MIILGFSIFIASFSGIAYFILRNFQKNIAKIISFILLGVSGCGAIFIGLSVLISQKNIIYQIESQIGGVLPSSFQFMIDPLSGFFLTLVGIIVISVACYGNNGLRSFGYFFTGIFVCSMYLVLIAKDVFTFMLAWELMSISSYFLVAYKHENATNRRAALVYLLMSQISGFLILFAFSILLKFPNNITPIWASIVFFLAFFGFGMKAGIVPLHFWLPEAHPVAPSHISALMSAAMLKVAIYGFIRFSFDYLKIYYWQCGAIVLFIGLLSALIGIICALMQKDLKKILAYSSIENIGIIFISLGLALIFNYNGYYAFAALGLIAALYHCLNHAIFKSLLFLGAGIIIQQSKEHDLNNMGGLIKKMPYTGWFFLIGCISIASLPPFNGFVSEWMILQDIFASIYLNNDIARIIILVVAALIILISALALACFTKVYGVIFLGQERSKNLQKICDPKLNKIIAIGFLALLCIILGILPKFILPLLNAVSMQLINIKVSPVNWLWINAIDIKMISCKSIFVDFKFLFIILSIIIIFAYFKLQFFKKRKLKSMINYIHIQNSELKIVKPWDCGYGGINYVMQYNSSAFSFSFKKIFIQFILIYKTLASYCKFDEFSMRLAKKFSRMQGGNVRVYLAYTFLILILLLIIV